MEFLALVLAIGVLMLVQNILYRKLSFRQLDYRYYFTKTEVFEGEELELVEEVANRKWLPMPWFKSEITTSRWLEFAGSQSTLAGDSRFVPSFFMMKSYKRIIRRWKVRATKRGEFSIDSVVLVATDLLGNLSLSNPVRKNGQVLTVLPLPCDLAETFITPRYLSGDYVIRRSLIEDPFYIAGVREYTYREAMNRIHWKASAREQKLMVYNNDSTTRQSLSVLLNMQSREVERDEVIDRDGIERAIRVCAAVFEETLGNGMPLRFLTNGQIRESTESYVSEELWGNGHVHSLLLTLAALRLRSVEFFGRFLKGAAAKTDSTDLVIVTCYFDGEIAEYISRKLADGVHVKVFLLAAVPTSAVPAGCEICCLPDEPGRGGKTDETH